MNVYPIFELKKVVLSDSYQYILISRKALYYSYEAPFIYAEIGDILLDKSESDFWVWTLKNDGNRCWKTYPFEELPQEYKTWLLLVGT